MLCSVMWCGDMPRSAVLCSAVPGRVLLVLCIGSSRRGVLGWCVMCCRAMSSGV